MGFDQGALLDESYDQYGALVSQQIDVPVRSVLVLDDDIAFQALMNTLLTAHGYEVWQARSAAEASSYLAVKEPGLIIVDYRLPVMDGITWISQIRDAGNTTPIIFVSGTWCDAQTFSWLRNILKVSLVFGKPIDPHLFLQAIEDVLPSAPATHPGWAATSLHQSFHSSDYEDLLESGNLDESLQKLGEVIAASSSNPIAVHELTQIQRKLRTQKAVHTARLEYIGRMSVIWEELSRMVLEAHNDLHNLDLIRCAFESAHKLKGTSGSYGLTHISEIAAQIENFLKSIDPSCTKEETNIYWSEILHLLTEGTEIVHALTSIDPAKKEDQDEQLISLLLVSPDDQYRALISKTVAHNIDLHVVNSAAGAVR
jgi:DNA-binding response OmpR family regulator